MWAQLPQHTEHRADDALRGVAFGLERHNRRVLVKLGQPMGEAFKVFRPQIAGRQSFAEQRTGCETTHAHRVVDRLTGAMQLRRTLGTAHGHHTEVQRWCKSPVEAQLFLAEMLAQREGTEVDEGQAHRLLQLVCEAFSQQNP